VAPQRIIFNDLKLFIEVISKVLVVTGKVTKSSITLGTSKTKTSHKMHPNPAVTTRPPRSRYWCFTENDQPEALRPVLELEGLPSGILYVCGQLEQGDHLHVQGYVELAVQQRLSWLKKNLSPTAHFEVRRGTQEEAINYCRKIDDTTIEGTFFEIGEKVTDKRGKRNDILEAQAMILDGESEVAVADACFPSWVKYRQSFAAYRLLKAKKRDPSVGVEVIIYYGGTGLGKSRTARSTYPDAYVKPVGSVWFDGLCDHKEVLFDEFGGHWMPYGTLLAITDRYSCTVPYKGGHVELTATTLLFTTNRHPRFWYRGEYYEAFQRRISKIIYFEEGSEPRESFFPFDDIPEVNYGVAQPQNVVNGYAWN